MKTTRRSFLKRTLGAGAALAMPGFAPGALWGQNAPSNRITIGLIGMGLQMGGHRGGMTGRQDVQVLAVCDVHRGRLQAAKAAVESAYSQRTASGSYKGCAAYHEYERVMERGDIDAVMICTPDHWHAPISVAAMRSGKDVFVQKPMTLTIREGRIMSDVARQRGAILQVGSQQRSERAFRRACEMVRNGWIGKVKTIYASLGEFPPPRTLPEQPIPEGFDYDRWLGPTPWYPYHPDRVKGDYGGGWRCFWDYGSRKNGDWGAHHFDIIQWALGQDDSGPVEFIPKGYEGAEFQTHVYGDGVRVLRNHPDMKGHMIRFIGEKGEVLVSRGDRLDTVPAGLKDQPPGPADVRLYESRNHDDNWIQSIRSRRPPICPAEIGHRTATICHLSGIAERLKRPLRWDPAQEQIVGDPEASRWLDRPRRAPYVYI
ncbi:MAG TPA: Gfo/Idh/MocA family oxidoreductase [Candidatus Paceibacterota bacterium]|nr:Gfo/Idh/MocA family oxidoreductase [Verrucomicrobiota bacterium]HRZ45625.1 Gfo/Idh/MocA family oxidoreductase [Candidatus Paceibacterota bacterium]HRZ93218.1 Gfo/Idh/MocA family oxidoreductase [Candidatus Paceibacterota bacterium]